MGGGKLLKSAAPLGQVVAKGSAGPVAKGGLLVALWQPILKTSFAGRPMKILVIEDDRQTAQYLATGLRQQEHAVEVANNGRDGLFLAAGEKYDMMIVDRIPGLDGLGVVKTVRGTGVKTPVLASMLWLDAPHLRMLRRHSRSLTSRWI